MTIVRSQDRPVIDRGPQLPTLQRFVDRGSGSDAVTVLVNNFNGYQAIPTHVHDVEEVLIVVNGECVVTIGDKHYPARAGDAVIIKPGSPHGVTHPLGETSTVVAVLASADVEL